MVFYLASRARSVLASLVLALKAEPSTVVLQGVQHAAIFEGLRGEGKAVFSRVAMRNNI